MIRVRKAVAVIALLASAFLTLPLPAPAESDPDRNVSQSVQISGLPSALLGHNGRRALIIAPFYSKGHMSSPATGYSRALAARLRAAGWAVTHLGDDEEVYRDDVLGELRRPYDLIHITTHGGPQSFAVDRISSSDRNYHVTAADIEPFPENSSPIVYLAYCWSHDPTEGSVMPKAFVRNGASACVGFTNLVYFCDPNPERDLCRTYHGNRSAYDAAEDFYDQLLSGATVRDGVAGNCVCSEACPCNKAYDSCLAYEGNALAALVSDPDAIPPDEFVRAFLAKAEEGDIVLVAHPDGIGFSCSGFDHAALVTGAGQVTEAHPACGGRCAYFEDDPSLSSSGICTYSLARFVDSYLDVDSWDWVDIRLLRVRAELEVRAEAASFARGKACDSEVSFGDYLGRIDVDDDTYYCSHLVWASYKHADDDLEIDAGGMHWVRPSELMQSSRTYEIARIARGECVSETSGQVSSNVLVIDTSGSMSWNDPTGGLKITAARKAATSFISMLETERRAFGAENLVSLISFNSSAELLVPMTDDLSMIRSKVALLAADGGTNLHEALTLANAELLSDDGQPVIVLLSDGVPNVGISDSDDYRVHESDILSGPVLVSAENGFCIFAIGFGVPGEVFDDEPSIDTIFLDQIVRATGCSPSHYSASEAFELISTFIDTRQQSMEREEAARDRGAIKLGETISLEAISVPFEQEAFYIVLSWPGSALDLNLTDPQGRSVDHTYPGATIDVYDNMVYAIVEDPIPGEWQASIYGRDVPAGGTQYAFLASVEPSEDPGTPATPPAAEEPELGMFKLTASGPIAIALRDPEGRIVSEDVSQIDGVSYHDSGGEIIIEVPHRVVGDYELRLTVDDEADRLARFNVSVTDGFDAIDLAASKFIIHAPSDPYVVRSTAEGLADVTDVIDLAPIDDNRDSSGENGPSVFGIPILWIALGAFVLLAGIGALLWFLRSRHVI